MIHFDFTVSDGDAANIMEILRKQISRNNQQIIELIGKAHHQHYIDAYRQDNQYVEGLIKKMNNTRVEQ